VLATPLYIDNISGRLKVFMDRMMITASPYWGKDENGESRHLTTKKSPKLMMISNCGYPERSQFQVISHWLKRHARNINAEIIGEIYATEGALLSIKEGELEPIISNYIKNLEIAGREISTEMKLSPETIKALEKKFVPDEIYVKECKKYVNNLLKK